MSGQTHCNSRWPLLCFIVGLVAGIVGCALVSYLLRQNKPNLGVVSVQVDSCTTVDSISQTSPNLASTEAVGEMIVKVPEAAVQRQADSTGTRTEADSVSVRLPIMQSVYDGDYFKAYVSGYNAKLDSIRLCHHTTTITKTVTQAVGRRVDWGVYGATEINLCLIELKAGAFLDAPLTNNGRCRLEVRGGIEAIKLDGLKTTPFVEVGIKYSF